MSVDVVPPVQELGFLKRRHFVLHPVFGDHSQSFFSMTPIQRAVFLDRDGILNASEIREGRPYAPRRVEDFHIYPDARAALERLKNEDFLLIVATNQPDVGNGFIKKHVVQEMHRRLKDSLPIDDIEVCYSAQSENSPRRKPAPGMLLDAASRWQIDLSQSYIIGDRWSDMEAGRRAGCLTIWIDYGYTEKMPECPDFCTRSFAEAVECVLTHSVSRKNS